MAEVQTNLTEAIRNAATPLKGDASDYDTMLEMTRDKHFILMGEATHGTHEFYQARVEATKRLIREQGLNAIAIEGDWPSVYRVNRYVRGIGPDQSVNEALSDFRRFPLWMWRNTVVHDFVNWLKEYNAGQKPLDQVGIYGLDMYSLYESIAAVLDYLDQVDPEAAAEARERYECLDDVANEKRYGYGVHLGRLPSCEDDVVAQLEAIRSKAAEHVQQGGMAAEDEQFQAEQNARLVKSAEQYYRSMFSSRVSTWNMRDQHMGETLEALQRHITKQRDQPAKLAVWAHNSHLGDARATGMGQRGELNLGQLTRERYGEDSLLVGFTTYTGTVTAASNWDGPAECKKVRPGLADSHEKQMHDVGIENFFLPLGGEVGQALRRDRLERAIGVLYLPESERASHYFRARLPQQFDALFHFDVTRALEPLDSVSEWEQSEQETYPFGL